MVSSEQSPKAIATEKASAEAGVEGWISGSVIGTYEPTKKGASSLLHVFVIEVDRVLETWEQDDRERERPLSVADRPFENYSTEYAVRSAPPDGSPCSVPDLLPMPA